MQGTSFEPILKGVKLQKIGKTGMYYHYYEFPYWHHVQPHYGIRTRKIYFGAFLL